MMSSDRSEVRSIELESEQTSSPAVPTPAEPILCPHCLRTATNGIKCKGICVADSNY